MKVQMNYSLMHVHVGQGKWKCKILWDCVVECDTRAVHPCTMAILYAYSVHTFVTATTRNVCSFSLRNLEVCFHLWENPEHTTR